MKLTRTLAVTAALLTLAACHSKKQQQETVLIPPGCYLTRDEAQDFANRANADLAGTRAENEANGVQANALSCGTYKVVSTRNSDGREFWGTRLDTTGCSSQATFPRFSSPQPEGKRP